MDERGSEAIILEQLGCIVRAARCYVAGAVAAGTVAVGPVVGFGGEEGGDVDL